MAHPVRRIRPLIVILLALLLACVPARAGALSAIDQFPSLEEFVDAVSNGEGRNLRGIYVPGLLASWIVPQPEAHPWFVSESENTITHFGLPEQFGSIGLLAHNTLAGKNFSRLSPGQIITLVYGDGQTRSFIVIERRRFQALEPANTHSLFVDLDRGGLLTVSELFRQVYGRPGYVILQTCIEDGNELAWGRLFIIAEPYEGKRW
jgi:hypothetical protein